MINVGLLFTFARTIVGILPVVCYVVSTKQLLVIFAAVKIVPDIRTMSAGVRLHLLFFGIDPVTFHSIVLRCERKTVPCIDRIPVKKKRASGETRLSFVEIILLKLTVHQQFVRKRGSEIFTFASQ